MNYTKPEITSLASASFVIQGATQKADRIDSDSASDLVERTPVHTRRTSRT